MQGAIPSPAKASLTDAQRLEPHVSFPDAQGLHYFVHIKAQDIDDVWFSFDVKPTWLSS